MTLPKKVFEKVSKQYQENEIYKNVIDIMKKYIEEELKRAQINAQIIDDLFTEIKDY